ncbi:MAG: hypothetical protein IJR90_08660 [Clostridia bacterium]|nr:hypothetical protein [Clostridia bacterium]
MRNTLPLTAAQKNELGFVPPGEDALPRRDAATVCNLRGCLVYIWEKGGREYWYYVRECRNGRLDGYRKAGGAWVRSVLPVGRVERYY